MRVCVVGAAASGLPSIKACLENDIDIICYEKTSDIGGLWNYRPDEKNIEGTVMATTVVNTSKEMMAYSDFPPPEDWPNFMHHSKVNEYLHLYADHYHLKDYIKFNTAVKYITEEKSSFKVQLENGEVEHFDKVILCTGHHATPYHPQLRDVDKFKGRIMHAHEYRDIKGFEGKNVVLLGIGNSALDIAVDLAKIAKSVTISTRRGTWIFNKVAAGGMPYDTLYMTRFFQQHPTVNDALANLICSGLITVTDDVDTFTADKVITKNGRSFDCDVFITCTGYVIGFPFLDPKILTIEVCSLQYTPQFSTLIDYNRVKFMENSRKFYIRKLPQNEVSLYKFVFSPNNENLAVIGMIQPIGSILPISEIQVN
uniref:Flavin-containing monooxygenase n=1 Tax=Angiostrongylus cantonensis TaxID=6313 RepID=A0A0K0CT24_ANGCA